MTDRKSTSIWVILFAIVLPAYVASFGPACWLCDRGAFPVSVARWIYWPVVRAAFDGPQFLREPLAAYAYLHANPPTQMQGISSIGTWTHRYGVLEDLR